MTGCRLSEDQIRAAVAFHGHWCPGLALGVRAGELALEEVGRSGDEDVVAVTETDMCAVDAVQVLTGCTFGKGNLIFVDHGKVAFSFFRREDGKALRFFLRPQRRDLSDGGASPEARRLRRCNEILGARLDDLFQRTEVPFILPPEAPIRETLSCPLCGEPFMESRGRLLGGRSVCIPCFEAGDSRLLRR
ncbi:MAG TPA: FmdE family protein [Synergistaceae bacterium]|nr:FmdE family protein [Synergistaceae bacterium]HQH77931.1 FmdE family protein [Synergistaceae bacterium]HQK24145.1 FmdE family protein [Synergistaceae bacterium]